MGKKSPMMFIKVSVYLQSSKCETNLKREYEKEEERRKKLQREKGKKK